MSKGFYPAGAGIINYLFGSAYSAFGANRWQKKTDAVTYAKNVQGYFSDTNCHVVNEYFSSAPDYQWRVICEGKANTARPSAEEF